MPDPTPPVVEAPLFFLDYDGTLAPLVDNPMEAHPHPDVPELLVALEARYPLWIITGRYLHDLSTFFSHPFQAVGLHGMQEGRIGGDIGHTLSDEAADAIARLREAVPALEGLSIEEKGPTFAVHYRKVRDEAEARALLEKWMREVPEVLDPIWGKKVVEVRPKGISKGVAVRRIAEAHPARTPLYLGDDVTDEDAFAALDDGAVTVKVGEGATRARYRLPDVDAVVAYLKRYAGA